ncbi:Uncharacterised protein [Mycobacteroides abscessus subsp. abscessus]|nr:Uncharacterised protein [Mycobacteroides abscessus subsp. abscessus]
MARVAVIGGGYGGVTVAKGLDPIADVVLIEQKDQFVHHAAALRAAVDTCRVLTARPFTSSATTRSRPTTSSSRPDRPILSPRSTPLTARPWRRLASSNCTRTSAAPAR